MDNIIGRVVAVAGSQMTATLEVDALTEDPVRIGAMVKVRSAHLDVIGTIGTINAEGGGSAPRSLIVVDLLGEIVPMAEGRPQFNRGVTHYPVAGTPVRAAMDADLTAVYTRPSVTNVSIGTLYHDPRRSAFVVVDELLAKNFAVLGATGSGKSCAVTLLLLAILTEHKHAHIVLLDPHNEYGKALGDLAEIVNVDNLQLPFWLLDFEEAVGVLVRGGTAQEQEAQAIILKDAITAARRRFAVEDLTAASVTVDTPVPYKASDLLRLIDEAMGKLDNPDSSAPYLRLRTRLDSLRYDRRFGFMFSDWLVTRDTLAQILGRLLRIPVGDKPLTIIDLSGIPTEIADVVVAMLCRLIFDFRLVVRSRADAAHLAGLRGGSPLCPGISRCRFRGGQPGDYPARSRRTQIRHLSCPDHPAAFGAVVSGAVAMRFSPCDWGITSISASWRRRCRMRRAE